MMRFLKIYCAFGFLVLLASNIWSISTLDRDPRGL